MPELPEVETLRRQLEPRIGGRTVLDVPLASGPRYRDAALAQGSRIEHIGRRGKYLLLGCRSTASTPFELVVHLGMTGQLLWTGPAASPPGSHVHAALGFEDGMLWFRDPRRFGRVAVVEPGCYQSLPTLAALGPEPDAPEFSPRRVRDFLLCDGPPIKARLLEQRLVAGVGNYIADEALWHARVHPTRRELSARECLRVHRAVGKVIADSLAAGGVSERDYVHLDGSRGTYGERLSVHGRRGASCLRCRQTLAFARVAGRGTIWCPRCQPASSSR